MAKPAHDVSGAFAALAHELRQRGYRLLPDPVQVLPVTRDAAQEQVRQALSQADLAVHLLGESAGFHPEDESRGIVALQLAWSAAEKERRAGTFVRLIWAPRVLRLKPKDEDDPAIECVREPTEVLKRFHELLGDDQVEGGNRRDFAEFVLQRLEGPPLPPPANRPKVYVRSEPEDRPLRRETARIVKSLGCEPVLAPTEGRPQELADAERKLLAGVDRVVICWGAASEAAIMAALADDALQDWKAAARGRRQLFLLVGGPASEAKADRIDFGVGPDVDRIGDATAPGANLSAAFTPLTAGGSRP